MSEEFISILKETGAIGENIRDLFEKIRSHYSQPFRFYHTIDHIKEMLSGLQKIKDKINDFNLIYLAIWFHDVHYDPKASNNEEESADLAAVELQKLKIPSKNIKSICEMVLSTKWHLPFPNTNDCRYMLDLDLMVLGKPPEHYNIYKENIRKEYSWVPEADYRSGRSQVLKNFLANGNIYYTEYFKENYEKQAIENIHSEIQDLI